MKQSITLPYPAEDIIPHRLPMRQVDEVVRWDGTNGEGVFTIREDNILVGENGELEPVALIEIMAQTFAACKGFDDRSKGLPGRQGFLVAMRSFNVFRSARVGDQLQLVAENEGDIGEFTIINGKALCDSQEIANVSLRVWSQLVE